MKKSQTSRFEVDYKERLEQRRTATNAVRIPRLGYALYRVYEIREKLEIKSFNLYSSGIRTGKSVFNKNASIPTQPTTAIQWQKVFDKYLEAIAKFEESRNSYEVKWLKEKQATLLRLKGHRVELTTPDDKSTVGPVRLGE